MQIKKFSRNYNRPEFYSYMGKYFAEKKYQKEMPYLVNRDTNIWFLAFEGNALVAFAAVNEMKGKIVMEHSYVEEEYRKNSIWKRLNEIRLDYAKEHNKPVEVITKEAHLMDYWINNGFTVYRQSGRYHYLRRENEDDRKTSGAATSGNK